MWVGLLGRVSAGMKGCPGKLAQEVAWACDTWCVGPVSREQIAERSPPVDGAQDSQVQGGSPEKNTDALGVSCRIFAIVPAKPDLPPVPTGPRDSREAGGHLIFLLPLAR